MHKPPDNILNFWKRVWKAIVKENLLYRSDSRFYFLFSRRIKIRKFSKQSKFCTCVFLKNRKWNRKSELEKHLQFIKLIHDVVKIIKTITVHLMINLNFPQTKHKNMHVIFEYKIVTSSQCNIHVRYWIYRCTYLREITSELFQNGRTFIFDWDRHISLDCRKLINPTPTPTHVLAPY